MASTRTVLAVGDLLRDHFVESRVRRLSPESPNLIIEASTGQTESAGGVGIGARVLRQLGHDVVLASSWGEDDESLLQSSLGSAPRINLQPGRTIPRKTRYIEGHTILARVDGESAHCKDWSAPAIESLRSSLANADAVLVADYAQNSALKIPAVVKMIREYSRSSPVVWDYHPRSEVEPSPGAWVKFNDPDFRLGREAIADNSDLAQVAQRLVASQGWRGLLVTQGADGAVLVTTSEAHEFPTTSLDLRSAIGAGDTVSALWASWAGVRQHDEAAESAVRVTSLALAVREGVLHQWSGRIDAFELAWAARAVGKRVVATAGCFDLLHAGHLDLLESARGRGDALIVLLNSDRSVAELKGAGRPVYSVEERARILSSLRCVDAVVVFDEATPEVTLDRLRPHTYVKGGDYSIDGLVEATVLRKMGADIRIVPRTRSISTTSILAGRNR